MSSLRIIISPLFTRQSYYVSQGWLCLRLPRKRDSITWAALSPLWHFTSSLLCYYGSSWSSLHLATLHYMSLSHEFHVTMATVDYPLVPPYFRSPCKESSLLPWQRTPYCWQSFRVHFVIMATHFFIPMVPPYKFNDHLRHPEKIPLCYHDNEFFTSTVCIFPANGVLPLTEWSLYISVVSWLIKVVLTISVSSFTIWFIVFTLK